MARRTKAEIELERRLHRIESQAIANVQINVMDLNKISAAGKAAAAAGADDDEIRAAMDKVVAEVRQN